MIKIVVKNSEIQELKSDAKIIGDYFLYNNFSLKRIELPEAKKIGEYFFAQEYEC